jgi:hypothetical protein
LANLVINTLNLVVPFLLNLINGPGHVLATHDGVGRLIGLINHHLSLGLGLRHPLLSRCVLGLLGLGILLIDRLSVFVGLPGLVPLNAFPISIPGFVFVAFSLSHCGNIHRWGVTRIPTHHLIWVRRRQMTRRAAVSKALHRFGLFWG